MSVYEGNMIGTELKVGIVISRFNELLSSRLLSGANDALTRHGVLADDIDVAWVPGASRCERALRRRARTRGRDPRRHTALRVCRGRGLEGGRGGSARYGSPGHVRSHHGRQHRASDREGRDEVRQQGLGRGNRRNRDGEPHANRLVRYARGCCKRTSGKPKGPDRVSVSGLSSGQSSGLSPPRGCQPWMSDLPFRSRSGSTTYQSESSETSDSLFDSTNGHPTAPLGSVRPSKGGGFRLGRLWATLGGGSTCQ
jgi:hypothetical protein